MDCSCLANQSLVSHSQLFIYMFANLHIFDPVLNMQEASCDERVGGLGSAGERLGSVNGSERAPTGCR